MKILLDEMISFRVAAELRKRGHDVQAIKRDRPDLESIPDVDIVRRLAAEQRAIVTNNVKDFTAIHHRLSRAGDAHAGMIFTHDSSLPRNKGSLRLWVRALEAELSSHPGEDDLEGQLRHLP